MSNIEKMKNRSCCWMNIIDTCLITSEPGFFEHHNDLFLDKEIPEAIFPDEQDADADYLTSQLYPVADWP